MRHYLKCYCPAIAKQVRGAFTFDLSSPIGRVNLEYTMTFAAVGPTNILYIEYVFYFYLSIFIAHTMA